MRVGVDVRSLASPEMRGLTRYTVNLLRGLSGRRDVELVLFCRERPAPSHLDGVSAAIVTGTASRDFLWYDQWLVRQIKAYGVDVLHAPADRGLPLRASCARVVTVHGSFERAHWRALFTTTKERLSYWRHEIANGRANAVITVSETARRELIALGYPEARVHAIYPAPAPEFSAVADERDASMVASLGIRSPYILCVSGYNPHKNLDLLVAAFDASNLDDHQLVIVADKRYDYLAQRARWSTRSAFVRLVLVEADPALLPALYRRAAVSVNPSRWESFGFQLVEAMACGTPIVSSTAGALPEVAGDAAEYFDPARPEALTRLLQDLLRDRRRLDALRQMGQRRVAGFSWAHTIERTLDVYRRAAAA